MPRCENCNEVVEQGKYFCEGCRFCPDCGLSVPGCKCGLYDRPKVEEEGVRIVLSAAVKCPPRGEDVEEYLYGLNPETRVLFKFLKRAAELDDVLCVVCDNVRESHRVVTKMRTHRARGKRLRCSNVSRSGELVLVDMSGEDDDVGWFDDE